MKIWSDEQRQEYMARLKRLVDAIETYDKAKAHFEGLEQLQTEVKGSMAPRPGYPTNPNLPRGQDFMSYTDSIPDNMTPSESGMSKGRCPI